MNWEGAATITRDEFKKTGNSYILYRKYGIPATKKEYKTHIVEIEYKDDAWHYKWMKA